MAYPHARRNYTIVGIDPGTTVGIAILDLDGNPVDVFSAKNYSLSDAIARIIARGRPLIIASDVAPTPAMVKKIGGLIASHVPELEESLSMEEKLALTKGEGFEYRNAHERDALAASLHAFKQYKTKFAQIQKKTPAGVDEAEVKALVIKGVSISAAINRLLTAREEKRRRRDKRSAGTKAREERVGESKTVLRLRERLKGKDERIALLEERTAALKDLLAERERDIRRLKRRLDAERSELRREVKKSEVIHARDAEIEQLRAEVAARTSETEELQRIIERLRGKRDVKGGKRIKVIPSFTHDAIQEFDRKYGIARGDIVLFEDGSGGGPSTAELVAKKGVSAVIYGKELSHFAVETFDSLEIPALSLDAVPLLAKEEDFAFIDRQVLDEQVADWKQKARKRSKVLLVR
jgi:predicted RNase H-like nuclease (RuvC/YqgF family)